MRPTREQTLIETAYLWSNRGTCSRLQVGALIHREGRILVQGYNGAPSGMPHCNHDCDCPPEIHYSKIDPKVKLDFNVVQHHRNCKSRQPCTEAEHAERNAIAFAARWGVALEGAELVVTHQPCKPCAMSIINAGIKSVLYVEKYRLSDGVDLLNSAGVEVVRFVEEHLLNKIW